MLVALRRTYMNESFDSVDQPSGAGDALPLSAFPQAGGAASIKPQAGCSTCGGQGVAADMPCAGAETTPYVYAVGRVEARFPNLAAEKEFAQATGRTDTSGRTDQQT